LYSVTKVKNKNDFIKMIDLDKLEKRIDKLFETETSDSLATWLFNERYGNINTILGDGSFVNLSIQSISMVSDKSDK